jgi:hypothetical protein
MRGIACWRRPSAVFAWRYFLRLARNRIYAADGEAGLLVLPSLPSGQFMVRVDTAPSVPFTIEAATNMAGPVH